MMKLLLVLAYLLALSSGPALADPAPEWFLQNIERLTAETGVWTTSNDTYRSDSEQFADYSMEWRVGIGGLSASGALFGIADDNSRRQFWELLMFWHPGENRAYLQQIASDGTLGTGTLQPIGDDRELLTQQFFSPDGTMALIGHETVRSDGTQEGSSFSINEHGAWTLDRRYIWHLQEE